jgi:hypothetical protein
MRHGMGSPDGVSIKNEIWIVVDFEKKRTFHEVLGDTYRLLRFLEVVIGRQQNVSSLRMCRGAIASGNMYEVICSHPWQRKEKSVRMPHPGDVLLDPVREGRASSELIEAGWNIRLWTEKRSGISNPIGRYILNYKMHMEQS